MQCVRSCRALQIDPGGRVEMVTKRKERGAGEITLGPNPSLRPTSESDMKSCQSLHSNRDRLMRTDGVKGRERGRKLESVDDL